MSEHNAPTSAPHHAAPVEAAEAQTPAEESAAAYTLFAVFRISSSHPAVWDGSDVPRIVQELTDVVSLVADEGAELRGWYDVSGLRADADLMVWLHGPSASDLQWALRQLRRTTLLKPLIRVWSALGVHRTAEFNRDHIPGFVRGEQARDWLAVYPFVRSPEWYLLDPADRGRMLAQHGRSGAAFTGVVANTVSAFALGDYEWLLPMESDDLTELVDMMRELRGNEARNYVSLEVPFFTGRRIEPVEIVEILQ